MAGFPLFDRLRAWAICCGVSFTFRPNFTPGAAPHLLRRGCAPKSETLFEFGQHPTSATWRGLSASRCRLLPLANGT